MNGSNAEKWAKRGESYRQSVLDTAFDHNSTYDPGVGTIPLSYEERPEVSWPTEERVFNALLEVGAASTAEIAEHEEVNRSESQVRRALNSLQDHQQIDWKKDGRQVLYYPTVYEDYFTWNHAQMSEMAIRPDIWVRVSIPLLAALLMVVGSLAPLLRRHINSRVANKISVG